jgi:hypothetical protein
MATLDVNPSPGPNLDPGGQSRRIHWITDFWTLLFIGEDAGETTWRELEALQSQVTDALAANPPDITRAETLTAYAAALMSGMQNF